MVKAPYGDSSCGSSTAKAATKMAAFPLAVRSRVSARAISMAFRPLKKPIIELDASPSMPRIASLERRGSRVPTSPLSSRCLVSMLPLHSAIASARLRSVLAAESQRWGLVPQGISMPL